MNLPVYTRSGQQLGKVVAFDLDIDTHEAVRYHVKTGLIKDLWHEQLMIHKSQVISISKKQMIVDDVASKEPAPKLKGVGLASPTVE